MTNSDHEHRRTWGDFPSARMSAEETFAGLDQLAERTSPELAEKIKDAMRGGGNAIVTLLNSLIRSREGQDQ